MKSIALLLLSACGRHAGGLHLPHTSGATTGPASNATEIPVVVVMFDRNWVKMFDCFLRHWVHSIVDRGHTSKLDVVAYDRVAFSHAQAAIRTYQAGMVRSVQLRDVSLPIVRQLHRVASHAHTPFASLIYQAYYWEAIQERLEMGEDVLHMDLDSIVVGNAWAPLASGDPTADIVGPAGQKEDIGQQYVLYRNTNATKELVGHFSSLWKKWVAASAGAGELVKPPMRPDRSGLGDYVKQHNARGWDKKVTPYVCKMHTGDTLRWSVPASMTGLQQSGKCKFPEGCRAEGVHVNHGRLHMDDYCEKGENPDAKIRRRR